MNPDVAEAVKEWMPAFGLPDVPTSGAKDLKGIFVPISKFTDDETSRFFFPKRTLSFQQRMTSAVTGALRKRGAKIISLRITVEQYRTWLSVQRESDSPELRFRFATLPPPAVPESGTLPRA